MPFMSVDKFCTQTGMSPSRVKKMVQNAEIPVIPRTKERLAILIDLIALYKLVDTGQFILDVANKDN